MHQPPGLRIRSIQSNVCLSLESLYGLNSTSGLFQRFAAYAARVGFIIQNITFSSCIVLSILIWSSLNYFLGFSVTRNASGMFLSQQKYATKVLDRAGMLNCNPYRTPVDTDSKLSADGAPISDSTLYRSLAGALQYLTFTPGQDISICCSAGRFSYMHDLTERPSSLCSQIGSYGMCEAPVRIGLQLLSSNDVIVSGLTQMRIVAGCPHYSRSKPLG
ncbi:ribonuclease H-like domain-containing protein [Tanacetum coccineum]